MGLTTCRAEVSAGQLRALDTGPRGLGAHLNAILRSGGRRRRGSAGRRGAGLRLLLLLRLLGLLLVLLLGHAVAWGRHLHLGLLHHLLRGLHASQQSGLASFKAAGAGCPAHRVRRLWGLDGLLLAHGERELLALQLQLHDVGVVHHPVRSSPG